MPNPELIENSFTYHEPNDRQIEHYKNMRDLAKKLAHIINVYVPEGREKSLAITKLEEAIMWANKGISLESL